MNLPNRKRTRLKDYDYSSVGFYFVTICTHNHRQILSHIKPNKNPASSSDLVGQGLAPAEVHLTHFGKIAEAELLNLENRYANIRLDQYVIMPNHIHAIIEIKAAGASPCPTLSSIICTFKSMTTRRCHKHDPSLKLFQTSFHDHIIRGEHDYLKISAYIVNNPATWEADCFFTS